LTRELDSYNAAVVALNHITKHIVTAQPKCSKTCIKDTIAAIEAYKPALNREAMMHRATSTAPRTGSRCPRRP